MATLVDYVDLLATVHELIDGTGREVSFNSLPAASADPDTPWKPDTSADPVVTTVIATFVPISSVQDLGIDITDSELVRRTKEVLLCAPHASFDLKACQTLTDGTDQYSVVWVKALKPGDTELLLAFGVEQ